MIIVGLQGGLGNQMFQYAAGRALAARTNSVFKLDISFLESGVLGENVDYRKYGLNNFYIQEIIIDEDERARFMKRNRFLFKLKFLWLNKKLGYILRLPVIYNQKGLGFNPDFNKLTSNTYLMGYWQNLKYFRGYENLIKNDFKLRINPDKTNNDLIIKLRSCSSVSVHIRRGDFKNLPVLGTIDRTYYIKAINHLLKLLVNPVLFFFSDEMEWVKENFDNYRRECSVNYIDINNASGKEVFDMQLMSNCKHNIIGNSTFGWWGAYLNSNPDKIVIAPKKLFADQEINSQLQGMIPDEWIRL